MGDFKKCEEMMMNPQLVNELLDHIRATDFTFTLLDWVQDNIEQNAEGDMIYKGDEVD